MPNLTNTTWSFNNTVSIPSTTSYTINFTDGAGDSHTLLALTKASGLIRESTLKYNGITVYSTGLVLIQGWKKSTCQTITITGGTDATSRTFYNWLTANAYQTEITFTYTDKIIGSMGTEGTKTIGSQAQWLTDNITVEYIRIPGTATTPATTVTANPIIGVDSTGLITAFVSGTQSVTPTVSAGYVSTGTAGTITVSGSNTSQLSTQAATTITPTTSSQTAVAAGKYTTGAVTVGAIPSQYIVPSGTINITSNGTVDVTQYASANVNITAGTITEDGNGNIELGADGAVQKIASFNDVNFIDYDGTIVASYSALEFANLTAMPANPVHNGLTAQGWNWSLADAKAVVAKSGFLDIGQMYITSDGKTRIYISLFSDKMLSPRLCWSQTSANGVQIDWGDGSAVATKSGTGNRTADHTYASIGDYIITLTVVTGSMTLGNASSGTQIITGSLNYAAYRGCVTKVEIGSGISGLTDYTFSQCTSLQSISMPKTVTTIGKSAFENVGLFYITIPDAVAELSNYAFNGSKILRYIGVPKSVTSVGQNCFYSCTGLARLLIYAVTSIGANACAYNYGTFIMWFGSALTTIGATAFRALAGCAEYHFASTAPPTIASDTFQTIPSTANAKIYVPSASLSDYQSAWSAVASYMVGE